MDQKPQAKSYPHGAIFMTYRERLPTRKRSSLFIFKDISHRGSPQRTKHSKEAVDRYIRDYESIKVVRAATADIDKISQITRLSKRVISQYLDLIPTAPTPNYGCKPRQFRLQINKEKPNDTLIRCSRRIGFGKTGAVLLKIDLTDRYRFCYT